MSERFCGKNNSELVEHLVAIRVIKSDVVKNTMLAVDRSYFAYTNPYMDSPQSIGSGVNISAPHMHAYTLEYLKDKLKPGAKVLDIGSGSGYMTACFAILVGITGKSIGIDHIEKLIEVSKNNINKFDSSILKQGHLNLIVGDGRNGYSKEAPYDVIYVGAAAPVLPQILVDQLKIGGRLLITIGPQEDQKLTQIDKKPDGTISETVLMKVRFASLTDKAIQLGNKGTLESNLPTIKNNAAVNSTNKNETPPRDTVPKETPMDDVFIGKRFNQNKFEIKSYLGRGSFSSVYLCTDTNNNERAVKIMSMQTVNNSDLNDISLLKSIDSDFVIKYYEHFSENFHLFIVTELCKNGDLYNVIEKHKKTNEKINVDQIIDWTLQAAKGLRDLHSKRIIHRDIKPQNIFLTNSGNQIKLGDLGVSKKILEDKNSKAKFTMRGTLVYMSPEIIQDKEYSYNTDIWSLGCVVYELLFLKVAFPNPFIGHNVENLDFQKSLLSSILQKMLRTDSDKRPTSNELIADIQRRFYEDNE